MTAVDVAFEMTGPEGAETVVLAGSLGSTKAMWGPQVAALSERFRVVTYDLRGHGRSPVPPAPYDIGDLGDDLERLVDRLGVERVHAVGLSLGGMSVLRLASSHPDRVARLAVLCTSARLGPATMWAERAKLVESDGMAAVAPAVVARWFTPERQRRDPDLVAWAESMVASQPVAGYAACCRVIEVMDLRPALGSVAAPLLAIAGAQDPATPPEHLREIAEHVADGRLVVVDDAAHLVNLEQPGMVNALLLDHLDAQ